MPHYVKMMSKYVKVMSYYFKAILLSQGIVTLL